MIARAVASPSLAARCQASFMPLALTQTTAPTFCFSFDDLGVCKLARPSTGANPVFGAPRFAVRRGHEGVAAKADHVVKAKLSKKAEQLGVAEAAVGEDRHLLAVGQRLLEPD